MRRPEQPQIEMQIAPLIDVCFLLLFFYILTSKPVKPEGDLGLRLPGTVEQEAPLDLPDEQRLQILETGQILLNEAPLDSPSQRDLPQLVGILSRLRQSATANRAEAILTLDVADAAKHQRIVDVLNACTKAGVTNITFAAGSENRP